MMGKNDFTLVEIGECDLPHSLVDIKYFQVILNSLGKAFICNISGLIVVSAGISRAATAIRIYSRLSIDAFIWFK
jgi:hypothetical protein